MIYRLALPTDAARIALLHSTSWQHTYQNVLSAEYLNSNKLLVDRETIWQIRLHEPMANQFVLLAEQEDVLQGFMCLFADEDVRWGSLLDNLHVSPSAHGQGVGTALLQLATDWLAKYATTPRLYLWVYEANHPARGFYERLGARQAEQGMKPTADGGQALTLRYCWDKLPDGKNKR